MIQLDRSGPTIDPTDIARVKARFEMRSCARLPRFLAPGLVSLFGTQLNQGAWRDQTHHGFGRELVSDEIRVHHGLHLLLNDPRLLDVFGQICAVSVTSFLGRVYRMSAEDQHYLSWHEDVKEERRIGLSVNLGPPYEGGVFEIRSTETRRVLARLPNTGLGDAIIFRISGNLEHRVTPLKPGHVRTALAGWYRGQGIGMFAEFRRAWRAAPEGP